MPKFSELATADAYRQLPQVTPSGFQLLWHCDYWDGPRSGLLVFQGERCWFEVFAENDDEDEPYVWWRLFAIVRLTPEQLAQEEHWHELFRQKVGTHTDYHETGVCRKGELRTQKEWWDFYAAHASRKPMNLDNNEVLAWFEDRREPEGRSPPIGRIERGA